MSSTVCPTTPATHRVIAAYHCVCAIIKAAITTVRNSAAVRRAIPMRNRSETILLHPSVERRTRNPERCSRTTDVSFMILQRSRDSFSFHDVELGGAGRPFPGHFRGGG